MPVWNWKKFKWMLSNTLRPNLCYLKIICILHPLYHPKIIGYILKKSKRRVAFVFLRLILMKMKMEMKNRSHRYNINRSRSRHRHEYSKYKKWLSIMMFICIKQHLNNIWSSVHEKVKQHWGWVEKKLLLIKKSV